MLIQILVLVELVVLVVFLCSYRRVDFGSESKWYALPVQPADAIAATLFGLHPEASYEVAIRARRAPPASSTSATPQLDTETIAFPALGSAGQHHNQNLDQNQNASVSAVADLWSELVHVNTLALRSPELPLAGTRLHRAHLKRLPISMRVHLNRRRAGGSHLPGRQELLSARGERVRRSRRRQLAAARAERLARPALLHHRAPPPRASRCASAACAHAPQASTLIELMRIKRSGLEHMSTKRE